MDLDSKIKPINLLYILPKKATIILNPILHRDKRVSKTQYEIYSVRGRIDAIESLMRDLVQQADAAPCILYMRPRCKSTMAPDVVNLFSEKFQFAQTYNLFARASHRLDNIPYDVVAVKETDNGFTIVNNEYYATAFVVRNIYKDHLRVYPTKSEAELLFTIDR
jgi:hypothetical protein